MKWITLLPLVLFLTACGYNRTQVVEYQQVTVVPVVPTVSVVNVEPIDVTTTDVTTTTVECY